MAKLKKQMEETEVGGGGGGSTMLPEMLIPVLHGLHPDNTVFSFFHRWHLKGFLCISKI